MSVPSFNLQQFQQKVDTALQHVQRILTNERFRQVVRASTDKGHVWEDKFGLAECLSNTTIAALLTSFEQLELNSERLSVALGWKDNKQSVSLRLYSEETCRLNRQADRKVEGDEYHFESAFVEHTSKTITTIHEWFWDFQVSYRLVLFAGADSNADDSSKLVVLFDRQRRTEIITRTETPPHPSVAIAVDQCLNITPLVALLSKQQQEQEEQEHDQIAVRFRIDTESPACRTPRRNPDTESLLAFLTDVQAFFRDVSTFCARVNARETTIFLPPAPRMNQEIPVDCHAHPLKRCKGDDGWRCDGHANTGGCRSGITDFHQTNGVERFRCAACDYDLCLRCLNANRSDYRSPQPFPSRLADSVFVPVVPLFDRAPTSQRAQPSHHHHHHRSRSSRLPVFEAPLLSNEVIDSFLEEHHNSLLRASEGLASLFHAPRLIGPEEARLAVVAEHVVELIGQHAYALEEIEQRLYSLLSSAVGKVLVASDFEAFMRWHNQKFFVAKYRQAPFAFAVRRPGHSPEGTISIERPPTNNNNDLVGGSPIYTSLRSSFDGNAPMHFAINAATNVSFRGERHVHAWTTHQFDGEGPGSSIQLVARARQFSSFILLVGKIASARLFQPTGAIIVQNKGEVTIPLELEPLPTPKEFRDAIVSLSPEQQAFAKAFRAMQLESSQFAVCVIDLKPQLETLLRLPIGSLTKEIQLAQDLQTLFIDYQIPSDLLTFDGPEDASLATKIDVVKSYVAAVQGMIAEEKRRIEEEAERKRLAEELRRRAEEEARRRAEEEARLAAQAQMQRERESCREEEREVKEKRMVHRSGPAPRMNTMMLGRAAGSTSSGARGGGGPPGRGGPVLSSAPAPKMAAMPRQQSAHAPAPSASASPAFSAAPAPTTSSVPMPTTTPTAVVAPTTSAPSTNTATTPPSTQQQPPEVTTVPDPKSAASSSPCEAVEEGEDYTQIPVELDARFSELDADNCLRTTTVKPSTQWIKKAQATLLSPLVTTGLNKDGIKTEQNQAFDLLDFLSRSGSITLEFASLHVFMAATHCFSRSLVDSLIKDNINPIDKLERSLLIMASTVQKKPAVDLIKPQHLARVSATHPQLFSE